MGQLLLLERFNYHLHYRYQVLEQYNSAFNNTIEKGGKMSGTNIDHAVAIVVFLAAILIFIGLFSQTAQTAITYQQHNSLSTKTSDLLDNLLLNPGNPSDWGQKDWSQSTFPTSFGVQHPEFIQYQLSPFSVMRLSPVSGRIVNYQGQTFYNETTANGGVLLVPTNQVINYSQASRMMGINGTYGFSLTVSPTVEVVVSETSHNPLVLSVLAKGPGSPLSNAAVTYCLLTLTGNNPPTYPSLNLYYGNASTGLTGEAFLNLQSFVNLKPYFILVQVSLPGVSGTGYFGNSYNSTSIVPIITSFESRSVVLAHSFGIDNQGYNGNLTYTSIFLRAKDMIQTTLNNGNLEVKGMLYCNATPSHQADQLTIDPEMNGVLVVAFSKSALESGIVVMPWGLSSLGFTATIGGQHPSPNWVSTDMRQVLVNDMQYQAKLALWSSSYGGVTG
jgi:hypothetical protein